MFRAPNQHIKNNHVTLKSEAMAAGTNKALVSSSKTLKNSTNPKFWNGSIFFRNSSFTFHEKTPNGCEMT